MSRQADTLQARAEVLKLARLLDREPDTLAYLEPLELADIRALRERTTEVMFDSASGSLKRLAAATKLLPSGVSASIAEGVFGPLLSARLTGLLDPDRAVDIASKLSIGFLADVAIELDPRRASDMIARIPAQQIGQVTAELMGRGEYVTMGRFVGHLSREAITAAVAQMHDRSLLGVVFVLEDKQHAPALVAALPPERIAGVVRAAAADGLWVEVLDLLDHLPAGQRSEVVLAGLTAEPSAFDSLIDAVIENDLWDEVLPVAEHAPEVQEALAGHLPSLTATQRESMAARARAAGVLDALGPLGDALR